MGEATSLPPVPPVSFGMKAVGLAFNPSGDERVNKLKTLYAEVIDILADLRAGGPNQEASPEIKRLASVAITEAQTAQMWAVKAVTWKD